ncbi:hypothetical protein AB8A28_05310 [Tardiphaga sp. 71_E8_N1_1]|uniref:hypothetical protein n=1 Tax=Tardiphaga sp. 71_E8_N1_1 TaxID=3240784 RepID=UPI003F894A13
MDTTVMRNAGACTGVFNASTGHSPIGRYETFTILGRWVVLGNDYRSGALTQTIIILIATAIRCLAGLGLGLHEAQDENRER